MILTKLHSTKTYKNRNQAVIWFTKSEKTYWPDDNKFRTISNGGGPEYVNEDIG